MGYIWFLTFITVFFAAIMFFTCVAEIKKKKYALAAQTAILLVLFLLFLILQAVFRLRIQAFILFCVMLTLLAHNELGCYLDYYKRSKHFDRYLHAFGTFSFALFFYSLLNHTVSHGRIPKVYTAIFVATIGISLGCVVEIVEFCLDIRKHTKHQRNLKDTDVDLIADIIGSIVAGIISVLFAV